jgi:hypothetical protein
MAYPNLPGIQVTLNDLGLQVAAPPAGPKLTLLGCTSNTGIPLREPLAVTNVTKATASLYAKDISGKTYPGELALAVDEATAAGAGNIEVVVIAHKEGQPYRQYTAPSGNGPHYRYQDLTAAYSAIEDRQFDIVHPVNAWADHSGTSGQFGKQLANFCYQVTTEIDSAAVGVVPMMPVYHWALEHSGEVALNAISTALKTEIGLIDPNATGDVRNLFFKTPSTELIGEWEKYATQSTAAGGNVAHAVKAVGAWTGYLAGSEDTAGWYYPGNDKNAATAVNSAYFTNWQASNTAGGLVTDGQGNKADAGSRISVVGAPLITSSLLTTTLAKAIGSAPSLQFHTTNGAAGYAGFMTSLRPHSAPTNKQISNLAPQRVLSARQANRLAARRIVTFHRRSNGFVVANAMTGAHNVSKYVRSDYVRLSTVRIVDAAVEVVRALGDRYIGEPNTAAMRNAMSAEIDKVFAQMKQAGALNDYQFFVSATPDQQVLGEAVVDMTLVPAFELLSITVQVSLAKEL